MIDYFVYRVIHNMKKWHTIPKLWKQDAMDELESEGYILNEDGTVTKKSDLIDVVEDSNK